MTVRAYAPGRVNLIGEHTDYNDGFALPIALQVGTVAEFDGAPSGATIEVSSAQERGTVVIPLDTTPHGVGGWAAYVAGCVWALRDHGIDVPPGELRLSSDVPVGAGLSSSAALECAVLLALAPSNGLDRTELARVAQRAENAYVGAPTGLLDQMASLYGEDDTALLLDFRSLAVDPVPMRLGDDVLLAIDSRTPHQHAAGEYRRRREACEAAAAQLGVASLRDAPGDAWERLADDEIRRRARHVLTENRRVLDAAAALRGTDHSAFGVLMNASQASMRDDFEITVPAIDLIAATAVGLGAHGARMTGGGFGGTVIALAPEDAARRIADELPGLVARAGHPVPTVAAVRPGRGAHVLPEV
ncbi:galactokinase [Tsukamurella pseudospumae]|uniref:Galactokinase n=1 Tax=Tsukamurella pseudospumae TaxID=239498 RepID=A0A138ANY2_9ACTN|nr:galactokinase [Tsukamurella pseudospumae]KXP00937.1 galactokinase [Tsukamurella pseudospumae]KXP12163.1 galactokinase [Tsukamurella pseudospumae]